VIKDARARQRRQRLAGLLVVAGAAATVLALGSIGGDGGGVGGSARAKHGRGGAASSGGTHPVPGTSVAVLPAGGQIFGYQLTADGRGAGTLVWSTAKFVGTFADSMIRVSEQNSQGTWSKPVQLGGLHQSLNPILAESGSGAAAIVWSWVQGGPDERTVLEAVTRRSAGSAWSAPHAIWSVGKVEGALATVGIDSAGVATIVWTSYGQRNPAIWTVRINTDNAIAAKPRELVSGGAGGTDLTLAENGAGAALLSWQRQQSVRPARGSLGTVHAAEMVSYRLASGRWLAPHRLSTFTYPQEPAGMNIWAPTAPQSTVTAEGVGGLAWLPGMPLELSTRDPATGTWSQTRIPDSRGAFNETIVSGPHNSLRAFWSSSSPRGTRTLRTATSPNGVRWSATSKLSLPDDTFQTFVASDPSGSTVLAFTDSHRHVFFTTRTVGNDWSAPQLVGRGFAPVATISGSGPITVSWTTGVAPHTVMETRTYR